MTVAAIPLLRAPRDFFVLIKLRITALVTLTALAGYGLAPEATWSVRAIELALGVFLITAGASVANMFLERDTDALMARTRERPLPARLIPPRQALLLGAFLSVLGFVSLAVIDGSSALIALASWVLYVLVYTPLKARTSLNTVIGAVPGALPPLIGWTAAKAPLSMEALVPFFLLFVWQVPHFLALAWMYRDDYEKGGLQMLPVTDREGAMVGRQAFLYAACLLPISAAPLLSGSASPLGTFFGIGLALIFVGFAARFAWRRNRQTAASLFGVSLLYLPCAFAVMFLSR